MPRIASTAPATGVMETATIMLLSAAVKAFSEKKLAESIVIVIPDTGKAKFSPSHAYKKGDKDMESKATFVVAELGSSYQGVQSPFSQGEGDTADLPLFIKLNVIAQPPNRDGKTIDEALNRKVELAAVKTGTDG